MGFDMIKSILGCSWVIILYVFIAFFMGICIKAWNDDKGFIEVLLEFLKGED